MNVYRGKITGGKRGKLENVAINHADATVDATANSKDVALNLSVAVDLGSLGFRRVFSMICGVSPIHQMGANRSRPCHTVKVY